MKNMSDTQEETQEETPETPATPETPESAKVVELRRRLALYRDMETNILTGGAQSYSVGGKQMNKYGVSLTDIRNTISDLESQINAEITGAQRFSGCMIPADE